MRPFRDKDFTTALTLVDYGLSSLTNFATTFVVLRTASRHDLGTFALVYASYLILLGITRAAMSDAHLMDQAGGRDGGLSVAATQVLTVVSIVSVIGVPVGLSLGGSGKDMVLLLCLAAPGLMLQDLLRFHAFAEQRPGRAALPMPAGWSGWGVVRSSWSAPDTASLRSGCSSSGPCLGQSSGSRLGLGRCVPHRCAASRCWPRIAGAASLSPSSTSLPAGRAMPAASSSQHSRVCRPRVCCAPAKPWSHRSTSSSSPRNRR